MIEAGQRPPVAEVKATHFGPKGETLFNPAKEQPKTEQQEKKGLFSFLRKQRTEVLPQQPEGPKHVLEAVQELNLIEKHNNSFKVLGESIGQLYDRNIDDFFSRGNVHMEAITATMKKRGVSTEGLLKLPPEIRSIFDTINQGESESHIAEFTISTRGIFIESSQGVLISVILPTEEKSLDDPDNSMRLQVSTRKPLAESQHPLLQTIEDKYKNKENLLAIVSDAVTYSEKVAEILPEETRLRLDQEKQLKDAEIKEIERIRTLSAVNRRLDNSLRQENSTNSENIAAEVLARRDQELLEKSTKSIIKKMIADYPNQLPEAIILPDTSGRPLAYLLRPVFAEIANQRGLKEVPKLIFFKPGAKDDSYFEEMDEDRDISVGPLENDSDKSKQPDLLSLPQLQYTQRANEVINHLENSITRNENGLANIAIVDDYAMDQHRTITTIRNAFRNKDIPAYPLLVQTSFLENENIRHGMLDPVVGQKGSGGFDYRVHQAHAVHDTESAMTSQIGVTKIDQEDSLYVRKAENTSHDAMRSLRHDMRNIGERIAQSIKQST